MNKTRGENMKILDLDKVRDLANEKLDVVEKSKRYRPNMSDVECVAFTRDIIIESEDVKAFREDVYKIPFVTGCWILSTSSSIIIEVRFGLKKAYITTKYFNFVKVTTKKVGTNNANKDNYRVEQVDIVDEFDGFVDIKKEIEKTSKQVAENCNFRTNQFHQLLKSHNLTLAQFDALKNYESQYIEYIDYAKITEKMKGE